MGFHLSDIDAGIGSQLCADGEVIGDGAATASTGTLFPLPNIGITGTYVLADQWTLFVRGDVFALEIDDWAGQLWSGELDFIYTFDQNDNWSIGAGVNFSELKSISTGKPGTGLSILTSSGQRSLPDTLGRSDQRQENLLSRSG